MQVRDYLYGHTHVHVAQSSTVQLPHHAAKHAEIRSLKVAFYTSIIICMNLVVKNYIQGN